MTAFTPAAPDVFGAGLPDVAAFTLAVPDVSGASLPRARPLFIGRPEQGPSSRQESLL